VRVAILGPNAGRDAGSVYDDRWEIWGINSVHARRFNVSPRWTRMFNLHRLAHLERDCPEYVDWDATFSRRNPEIPIYVIDSWNGLLKNEVLFPKQALDAKLPRNHYHASSFDWLVAYAVYLKAKRIDIHGAQFVVDGPGREPISAQACLEYWCGYAEGKGIPVTPLKSCELFNQYHLVRSNSLYGYDDVRMVEDRT